MTTVNEALAGLKLGDPKPNIPYVHNIESNVTVCFNYEKSGAIYYDLPWQIATQEQIDDLLIEQARTVKNEELVKKFSICECAGFEYQGNTFCFKNDGLVNINDVKSNVDPADPYRYKFADITGTFIDFVDPAGWDAFKQAICTQKDKVMVYYVNKKAEIKNAGQTGTTAEKIAEIEAITINFNDA